MLNDAEFARGMKEYEDSLSEMPLLSPEELLEEELEKRREYADYVATMADYANDEKWINGRG